MTDALRSALIDAGEPAKEVARVARALVERQRPTHLNKEDDDEDEDPLYVDARDATDDSGDESYNPSDIGDDGEAEDFSDEDEDCWDDTKKRTLVEGFTRQPLTPALRNGVRNVYDLSGT